MPNELRNIGASVRARLLNIAKERNQPFDLLLTRYALERLLYRLGSTKHRERFALKGAMLLATWIDDPFRPTRDLDLLGFGNPDPDALLKVFKEICAIEASDAVIFDVSSFAVDRIRDETEYGGLRIKGNATVDGARVRILIDIAFGDAIEPGLEETDLPVLLDFPAPRLRSYPRETVVAEKFQAMAMLGRANSRMKDFYDIWVLSRSYEFKGDALPRAIAATFSHAARQRFAPSAPTRFRRLLRKTELSRSNGRSLSKMSPFNPARSPKSLTASPTFSCRALPRRGSNRRVGKGARSAPCPRGPCRYEMRLMVGSLAPPAAAQA